MPTMVAPAALSAARSAAAQLPLVCAWVSRPKIRPVTAPASRGQCSEREERIGCGGGLLGRAPGRGGGYGRRLRPATTARDRSRASSYWIR